VGAALATFITTRFITKEKLSSTLLSFGPSIKPYLFTALAVPFAFIITYLLTWAGGGQTGLAADQLLN
jgi:hypothetical protein